MVVDGKAIAEKIKASLREEILKSGKKLRLAVVQVGSDPVTEKFLEQKKKFAEAIGVDLCLYRLPQDISTKKLREKVSEVVHIEENTGVIVQLPLPEKVNTRYILDAIIPAKDPDMLSSKSWGLFATGSASRRTKILPPVAGAMRVIFQEYKIEIKGKNAVVVGAGKLVGRPVAMWLMNEGATVSVVDENTADIKKFTREADIVISGAGKAGVLTPDMIREGAIVIDAGTSESGGVVKGDVDPAVSQKASLFSPVPGGVGPLTVAMLFKNMWASMRN